LVDQTVDLIREQADVKGLSLQIRKTDQLPPACLGDPVRLKQVILNLVSNAIKFTRRGAIVVAASREGSDLVFQRDRYRHRHYPGSDQQPVHPVRAGGQLDHAQLRREPAWDLRSPSASSS